MFKHSEAVKWLDFHQSHCREGERKQLSLWKHDIKQATRHWLNHHKDMGFLPACSLKIGISLVVNNNKSSKGQSCESLTCGSELPSKLPCCRAWTRRLAWVWREGRKTNTPELKQSGQPGSGAAESSSRSKSSSTLSRTWEGTGPSGRQPCSPENKDYRSAFSSHMNTDRFILCKLGMYCLS